MLRRKAHLEADNIRVLELRVVFDLSAYPDLLLLGLGQDLHRNLLAG